MIRSETISTIITEDPSTIPDILSAVSDGMTQWQEKVKRDVDMNAYNGIVAALMLPYDLRRLNVDNPNHRVNARLVAVGMNMGHHRDCMSVIEKQLHKFVMDADETHPDEAHQHYGVLQYPPIGGSDD